MIYQHDGILIAQDGRHLRHSMALAYETQLDLWQDGAYAERLSFLDSQWEEMIWARMYLRQRRVLAMRRGPDDIQIETEPLRAEPITHELNLEKLAQLLYHPEAIHEQVAAIMRARTALSTCRGIHRAALFSAQATLLAEDISRHQAIEKLIGLCLKQNIPLAKSTLFTTSRLSSQILDIAKAVGIDCLISLKSTTTAGLAAARHNNIILVGFYKPQGYTLLYPAHKEASLASDLCHPTAPAAVGEVSRDHRNHLVESPSEQSRTAGESA